MLYTAVGGVRPAAILGSVVRRSVSTAVRSASCAVRKNRRCAVLCRWFSGSTCCGLRPSVLCRAVPTRAVPCRAVLCSPVGQSAHSSGNTVTASLCLRAAPGHAPCAAVCHTGRRFSVVFLRRRRRWTVARFSRSLCAPAAIAGTAPTEPGATWEMFPPALTVAGRPPAAGFLRELNSTENRDRGRLGCSGFVVFVL